MVIRFLDVELDVAARTVTRGGTAVHLSPKSFSVLTLLVEERPRAVPKTELLDRVWSGTFVTDASLTRTVHEIREALGDAAGSRIIRTVHGMGYAFAAAVHEAGGGGTVTRRPAAAPVAWLVTGARAIPLTEGEWRIGRDPAALLPLPSALVSWHHARLVVSADGVVVEDLGSKNGTVVGGQRLASPRPLADGDDIVIAGVTLVFRRGDKRTETETAER